MRMPAGAGSAAAYSYLLEASPLPMAHAHAAFERMLDEQEPAAARPVTTALDPGVARAVLAAGIRTRGEDHLYADQPQLVST